MIHRLITSLSALAAAPTESAWKDFEDALLVVRQCQSLHLTAVQSVALDRLERCLSVAGSSEEAVRAHASAALSLFRPDSSHR